MTGSVLGGDVFDVRYKNCHANGVGEAAGGDNLTGEDEPAGDIDDRIDGEPNCEE